MEPRHSQESNSPLGLTFQFSDRFGKRSRVALACCRCKARKSKCDGTHPSCSPCAAANAQCQYPNSSRAPSKNQYIRALEDHIVELQKRLAQQTASKPVDESSGVATTATATAGAENPSMANELSIWADDAAVDETDALTNLIRDLSCDSGGQYVGASSNIFMGRVIATVVKPNTKNMSGLGYRDRDGQSPGSVIAASEESASEFGTIGLHEVEENTANRMYFGYLQHISTRWPILHTPYIAELHCHKDELVDIKERALLHLVYANGGRYLETAGEKGDFFPERHYEAATQHVELMLNQRDLVSVQVLLLLGIYSLRSPKVLGAWNYVGLSIRTCTELGLHRRRPRTQAPTVESEQASRIFWSAYILDRQISLALGRPFALPDHDIDAELPLNINEESRAIQLYDTPNPLAPTSMICFRQTIKIRQIESRIKVAIYRLDQGAGQISRSMIASFRSLLDSWKDEIPPPYQVPPELGPRPYDGYDYYLHFYYNCLRQLYLPMVMARQTEYTSECAEACIGVCETFKKLHRNSVVGYSLWALQTVFLAGLTLIYTVWIDPTNLSSQRVYNALNSCNVILYVIVERWPMATKYRDAFEELKENLDALSASHPGTGSTGSAPRITNAAVKEVLLNEPSSHIYEQMVLTMMDEGANNMPAGLDDLVPDMSDLTSETGHDFFNL